MNAEARGWSIGRWLAVFAIGGTVLLLAALVGGGIALRNLTGARNHLLDVIGPQRLGE